MPRRWRGGSCGVQSGWRPVPAGEQRECAIRHSLRGIRYVGLALPGSAEHLPGLPELRPDAGGVQH